MADYDTVVMEHREEAMVSPTGGHPTKRIAHFLKPSVTSMNGPVHRLPPPDSLCNNSGSMKRPVNMAVNWWKNPPKNWKGWVDHMYSLHRSTWKKSGICDALMNSTYIILRDENLLLGLSENWCSETNSFVFNWGEATITLEDVMILGGYSVTGDSVFSNVETEKQKQILEKLNQEWLGMPKPVNHSHWVSKFMMSGSRIEHEAFLALWLSKFVFGTKLDTVAKVVFPIAVLLARGTKIALAPAVLSIIYRDLGLVHKAVFGSVDDHSLLAIAVSVPFELVQAWAWERFQDLRPKPKPLTKGQPRLARWANIRTSTQNVRSLLDSASESFHWRPYVLSTNDRMFCKFYKEKEECVQAGSYLDEELKSFVRCMRPCELVSLDCIEQYLPHRVAMQFGMDQDLPGYVRRANVDHEMAWKSYTRPVGDVELYFPSRLFESDVTTRYLHWWNQSVGKMKIRSTSLKAKEDLPPKSSKIQDAAAVDEDRITISDLIRKARAVKKEKVLKRGPDNKESKKAGRDAPTCVTNGEAERNVDPCQLEFRISELEKRFNIIKAAKHLSMSGKSVDGE